MLHGCGRGGRTALLEVCAAPALAGNCRAADSLATVNPMRAPSNAFTLLTVAVLVVLWIVGAGTWVLLAALVLLAATGSLAARRR